MSLGRNIEEDVTALTGGPGLTRDDDLVGAPASLLAEITQAMGSQDTAQEVLSKLALMPLTGLGADRCVIAVGDSNGRLAPIAARVREGARRTIWGAMVDLSIDEEIGSQLRFLFESPKTITIDDVTNSSLITEEWKNNWKSRSTAFAPFRAGEDIFGFLAVDYIEAAHAFTPGEAALLDLIARAAGVCLRINSLSEQVRHGVEVQSQLFRCSAALASEESPTRLLQLVVDGFMSLLNVVRCHIGLVSPDERRIHSIVWRGRTPEDNLHEMEIDDFPAEDVEMILSMWSADPRKPIVIPHLKELTAWAKFVPADIDLALLLPLTDEQRVIGIIMAGREGFGTFSEEELAVATAFADQAAAAIQRARLHQSLATRVRVNDALQRLSDFVAGTSKCKSLVAELNETVCADVDFKCQRVTFRDAGIRESLKLAAPDARDEEILRRWRKHPVGGPQARVPTSERHGRCLAISVPMGGRVAGILWVDIPDTASPEEVDLTFTIASGLGEVAHKAKLSKSLESRTRELAIAADRERIAADLHDTVGQNLYGIGLRVEDLLLDAETFPDLAPKLEELRVLAAKGASDIRSAIYALSFLQVKTRGFMASLRELIKQFKRSTGIQAELRAQGSRRRLPESVSSALYRVAHEALVNIDKHARASSAVVALDVGDDQVALSVTDDGYGLGDLDEGGWVKVANFGLRAMWRAVEEVGGRFQVLPGGSRGLRVECVVPLPRRGT